MTELAIELSDVVRARERIQGQVANTDVERLPALGFSVKREDQQTTGSFKIRGATNAIRALNPAGVITGSSGNHGIALAHAAREAGTPRIMVVMAKEFSAYKRAQIEALRVEAVDSSGGNSQRDAMAQELATTESVEYISSHDQPLVIAGAGTTGLEILDAAPDVENVVVPIGGGGLASGVAVAIRSQAPKVRVIGVEPEGADDTALSLQAGRRVRIEPPDTICDGVRAQVPGELTFPIIQALIDEIAVVSDDSVREAMYLLWREGLVIEPSGAVSVAAARQLGLGPRTVCILSGGNVEPDVHADLIKPVMLAEGHTDSPG